MFRDTKQKTPLDVSFNLQVQMLAWFFFSFSFQLVGQCHVNHRFNSQTKLQMGWTVARPFSCRVTSVWNVWGLHWFAITFIWAELTLFSDYLSIGLKQAEATQNTNL